MELTAGTVGKGVAAIVGSGAGGYGIYALTTGDKSLDDSQQSGQNAPAPSFLFQVSGFGAKTGDYSNSGGSFGYAFGRFMLNPNASEEAWAENKKRLNDYDGSDLHSVFKSAKNNINDKGLQKECEKIYKKSEQSVVTTSGWLGGIWIFCSISAQAPVGLNESGAGEYTGKWASEEKNIEGLISTETLESNKTTWKHIFENVLKKDRESESKRSSVSSQFLAINSETELYNACKTAYKSDPTDTQSTYGDNVRNYCVLDASISLSKYPTEPGK